MSRYVATAAHRGATQLVNEFDEMLQSALAEYGPDEPVQFTNTAYHLPVARAMLAHEASTLGDLEPAAQVMGKMFVRGAQPTQVDDPLELVPFRGIPEIFSRLQIRRLELRERSG